MIRLRKAGIADSETIHRMQVIAFNELLEKYQDYETNPAAETVAAVRSRIEKENMTYYLIAADDTEIGALRIVMHSDDVCRIAPVFILPEFQGCGYAREVFRQIEASHPWVKVWKLDTIKEEPKLCRLYEAIGYRLTGREDVILPGMTLVYYEKHQDKEQRGLGDET